MTVQQLLDLLKLVSPEDEVFIEDDEGEGSPLIKVSIVKTEDGCWVVLR